MNRIDLKFKELKEQDKKAFIAFITAGDPCLSSSLDFALSLYDSGVDILEFGIPFSDPVAEGPVIQSASERALAAGAKLGKIFETVKELRKKTDKPLLFMMYFNCIYAYGTEAFFKDCKSAGVDGVIVPDLPFDEQWEIKDSAEKFGVHNILLVTPNSKERIAKIAPAARGFLYCVSSEGVTGIRSEFVTDFGAFSSEIKKHGGGGAGGVNTAIGFGISSPEQARELSRFFDGVIMGSAFVKIIGEYGKDARENIKKLARETRAALDGKI